MNTDNVMLPNVNSSKNTSIKRNYLQKAKDFFSALISNKAALLGLIIILILIFVALFGKFLMPYDPYTGELSQSLQSPSAAHFFGTDEQGRDIFSRVIDGTAVSLRVGVIAVAISLSIGTFFGAVCGYFGGKIDMILMRIMDIILAFPSMLLAIAFMSALGKGIDKAVIAISIVTIPEYARIVRGCVLSLKESEYVEAAKVIGNNDFTIIFKHILPNILSPIIVRATLGISSAILDTAALGFLGLGVQPPLAEWGTMLGSGRNYFNNAPFIILFPGLAITITVLAFNLLGDGLRDALDPNKNA
ncbi:nickel transporter permease [Clostridium butyricum]|uniref:nickel transporter permease n=1 Tax=Clostridium TaxID=1485 RepID=UPI0002C8B569|nr:MULTISPECIES: nickel transporter permease [Clostridium]ALP91645.1 peptide ABC transporter permease [Clostridium butyricum]ANF15265.1 peptide ABC transporter permease [Clostridium butyricum]AOR95214.1 peptide ABC transporter permease [Clostridium butyricum]EMU55864.1 glutathione transport system permease protein GsiD [Clostridium butyricum DKU-01]MDP0841578.1 ABC transporter permease [Clostridium butyricum]